MPCLSTQVAKSTSPSKIFDLLLDKVPQFTNWEEVESYKDSYNLEAIEKLKARYVQSSFTKDRKNS